MAPAPGASDGPGPMDQPALLPDPLRDPRDARRAAGTRTRPDRPGGQLQAQAGAVPPPMRGRWGGPPPPALRALWRDGESERNTGARPREKRQRGPRPGNEGRRCRAHFPEASSERMSTVERMLATIDKSRLKKFSLPDLQHLLLDIEPALRTDPRKREVLAEVVERGMAEGKLRAPTSRRRWRGNPALPEWGIATGRLPAQPATLHRRDYVLRPGS